MLPAEERPTARSPFRLPIDLVSDEILLPAVPAAVGRAREFARVQLCHWRLDEPTGDDLLGTVVLIVSELVTNGVEASAGMEMAHPGSTFPRPAFIVMRLGLVRRRSLCVEVWDIAPAVPVRVDADDLDAGGRGLTLVTALAKAWNHYPSSAPAGGKVVWAEVAVSPNRVPGWSERITTGEPHHEAGDGCGPVCGRHSWPGATIAAGRADAAWPWGHTGAVVKWFAFGGGGG
ncbi:ATP-binding protein [Streptosporangium soli]